MMRTVLLLALAFVSPWLRAAPGAPPLDAAGLRGELAALVKSSGLDAGVAIKDLRNGDEFLINSDASFPQGSSIRIHLVTELYRQAAAGKLSVDQVHALPESALTGGSGLLRYLTPDSFSMSLRDYAVVMIAANDHSAANYLTDLLGIDNINASLAAQGTPEIKFRRRVLNRHEVPSAQENEATPRAVMRALELIHRGEVVDRAASDAILEVLSVPENSYFRRDLPHGVRFAGRSGSGPTMRCDAGIVRLADRPFVLCVMVKALPANSRRDYTKADALIGDVTRLALRHFATAAPGKRAVPSGAGGR